MYMLVFYVVKIFDIIIVIVLNSQISEQFLIKILTYCNLIIDSHYRNSNYFFKSFQIPMTFLGLDITFNSLTCTSLPNIMGTLY